MNVCSILVKSYNFWGENYHAKVLSLRGIHEECESEDEGGDTGLPTPFPAYTQCLASPPRLSRCFP